MLDIANVTLRLLQSDPDSDFGTVDINISETIQIRQVARRSALSGLFDLRRTTLNLAARSLSYQKNEALLFSLREGSALHLRAEENLDVRGNAHSNTTFLLQQG